MRFARFSLVTLFSLFQIANSKASGFTFLSLVVQKTHIPEHILTLLFVIFSLLCVVILYRRAVANVANSNIPQEKIGIRSCVESVGEFIYAQCQTIIGMKEGPKYFSFICFLFLFILASNLIGLIPGFLPPTENLNTTFAFGVVVFVYYNLKGAKEQGVVNYIKHFFGPLWYMGFLIFPIEIISNSVRPLSLALRLKGNMFGDHLVLGIFSSLVPYFVPVIFLLLGLLVCVIQAYVFCVLTMVYISLATHHETSGEAGHH